MRLPGSLSIRNCIALETHVYSSMTPGLAHMMASAVILRSEIAAVTCGGRGLGVKGTAWPQRMSRESQRRQNQQTLQTTGAQISAMGMSDASCTAVQK